MLPYSLNILRAMFDARCHWKPSLRVRQGYDHVRRLKNGKPSVHHGPARTAPESAFVFAAERGRPFTSAAVNRLIKRIGARARWPFRSTSTCRARPAATPSPTPATTPARSSPTWGHGNIRHTVLYTELAPEPRKR